jgi:tetratricopeptide (TPR) repeat protein
MSFSLIPTSPISGIQQYQEHLSKLAYLRSLKSITNDSTNYQLLEIKSILGESLQQNVKLNDDNIYEVQKLSVALNGSIQDGFNHLSDGLNDGFGGLAEILSDFGSNLEGIQEDIQTVGRCLVELGALLDWKTDLIIECQQTTIKYLKDLVDLSRMSDDQKKRVELINKSGMYLTNALNEGPDSESFKITLYYLRELDKIDPHDFICKFRKGILFCKSKENFDIDAAIENFLRCISYSEIIIQSNTNGSKKQISEELIRTSYYYLSECAYIKTNFFEGLSYAEKAYNLMPSNPDFCLRVAKLLCVNMREGEALHFIRQAIELDPEYANETIKDNDLNSKEIVRKLIENEFLPQIEEVESLLSQLRKYSLPESDEDEELEKLIATFNKSYVQSRHIATQLKQTNLVDRVTNSNRLFFKTCEEFQLEKRNAIQSILQKYNSDRSIFEKDYKSEYKTLGYLPSNGRFYLERDLLGNKVIACTVDNDAKLKNYNKIGALRITIPLIRELEVFDFLWGEWVSESEINSKLLTPICTLSQGRYSVKSVLVIKRNLNQYFINRHHQFGFSTCITTSNGYFVELGFNYLLRIDDPIAVVENFSGSNYPIEISDRLSRSIKKEIDNIPYREIQSLRLHEVRDKVRREFNSAAKTNKQGLEIHGLYMEGHTKYAFRNDCLVPVN